MTPFEAERRTPTCAHASFGGRPGRNFAAERAAADVNVFAAAVAHMRHLQAQRKRVIVAAFTPGARERLLALLGEHDLADARKVESFAEAAALAADAAAFAVLGIEQGFETPGSGDHRRAGHSRRPAGAAAAQGAQGRRRHHRGDEPRASAISSCMPTTASAASTASPPSPRWARRTTAWRSPTPSGDKLYLPVENIELLSRYGSADGAVQLDRLGGVAWQTRKARLKQRLREIASELIKVAALRQLRQAPAMAPPEGAFDEFVARFPYDETEDQATSIDAVLADLASGKPMDRLVCGDVGFGKTEVALRAAFVAALDGFQVAVVVPTTLLARQHFATFTERFKGLPVRIAQASRLVARQGARRRQGRHQGTATSTSSSARTRCSARRSASSGSGC